MTIIFITLAGERVETSDVKELKRRAANGEITPDTIVNVDGMPYLANKIKGLVFGTTANETPSAVSASPEVADFFFEQAGKEENAASFASSQESHSTEEKEDALERNSFKIPQQAQNCLNVLTSYVKLMQIVGYVGCVAVAVLSLNAPNLVAGIIVGVVFGMLGIGAIKIWGHVHLAILGLLREHFKINAQILAETRNLVEITEIK